MGTVIFFGGTGLPLQICQLYSGQCKVEKASRRSYSTGDVVDFIGYCDTITSKFCYTSL